MTLGAQTLQNVETITLGADFTYKFMTSDETVKAGATLNIDGSNLGGDRLIFDGSAETNGHLQFTDGSGNDSLTGGSASDVFFGSGGGSDTFRGKDSADYFQMEGNLDLTDFIDGGPGYDGVSLEGDYSQGLVLDTSTMKNIEAFQIRGNYDFDITTRDAIFAAGAQIYVQTGVGATNHAEFDASAETGASFEFVSLAGNAAFSGGAQNDLFILNDAGDSVLNGGGGADIFRIPFGFTVADQVHGGSGKDNLYLGGISGQTFGSQTITGIETIILEGGCTISTHDATVAAGEHITVDGSFLLNANEVMKVDASAETDGRYAVLGGEADDTFRGGAMNDKLKGGRGSDQLLGGAGDDSLIGGLYAYADTLTGGLGHDNLYGGDGAGDIRGLQPNGNDMFVFADVAESTVAGADWIRDWNAGDRIDVSAIDANTGVAGDQAFAFIGAGAFTGAGQLQSRTTALNTIISGDIDGDGTADFAVKLTGVQSLSAGSFIL